MDHRNRRLSMEPLESRHMLSVGTECTAPEDITALQGQQVAAIEATLDVQSEREQISPLLSQTFEGAQAAFNGSRAIDLGYNPQYNLQDFTIHTKALCTKEGGEQVIVGLNTQANRSYGYSGVTLNFSREGGVLKLWYAGPDTNYEVFTHFTPQLRREYDIIVIKQGGVLQLFVDGEHVEDIQLSMEKIVYNSTGRTMVSGLWSGEKRSALYQLNGAVSELEVYGDVYMPEKLQQAGGQTTVEETPLAEKNADPVQEAQPAQSSPLLSQTFEGAQAAFNGSRAIDLGYNPEYNLQDFTIHATIVAKGSEAEQVIVGLNTQANGVYGYSGVTLNCRYGNGPLKLWYAAPGTNHEVITSFQPEIGREYDIVVVKQGKQLRLFVDGEHFEDLICPVAEIRYNDTGRTMVSGLWSGTKKSGIYPFHGAISTLEIFDGAYAPKGQGAWEEIGIEDFIVPELRVLQIEGPNVLVHVASPTNQSIVNIGGNGVLATRTQLHEGGTPSTVMQVTMNAGNSRGHYAIQLTDRPGGLVLDSIPVYWNGSSLSLRNAEDGMEGVPAEWDIPAEYSMSSALVRNNLESDLAARSGLTYSLAQAEAAFYERHPEYLPQNLNATIDAEYARLPGFTRGQAQDRVLGDKFDLLARVQRGLNAFNGVLQGQVFPAAMNVFRGVLDGVPERTLYEQLDAAMCSFGRGLAVDLFLYTTITAPSRSQVLAAAREVFFNATDLTEYYHAKDEQLMAKGIVPETEDPFITAARQRGELWAQYMGQISAGKMTAKEALAALAADVSSTAVTQTQQQAVDQVMALFAEDPTLLADADDLLAWAGVEVGGVETENAVVTVSQTQIPLGGSLEIHWAFGRIYGDAVEKMGLYLVDLSASGSAQEIMVMDDQCIGDGSYVLNTSNLISQPGQYRILAVATLANGRIVGGKVEVRVGGEELSISENENKQFILHNTAFPAQGTGWSHTIGSEFHREMVLRRDDGSTFTVDHTHAVDLNCNVPYSNADADMNVYSSCGGTVVEVVQRLGYVVVEHELNGVHWFTEYMHLNIANGVTTGLKVNTSDVLGTVGHVAATNDHIHYVISIQGEDGIRRSINPAQWLMQNQVSVFIWANNESPVKGYWDANQNAWVSDESKPRIWDIDNQTWVQYSQ